MSFYLITGGAGFIGSNLCEELLLRGHRVRVLDNLSTGKAENIEEFLKDIELVKGDTTDYETVKKAVKGIDYVIHLAAVASVQISIANPAFCNQVNVDGTLNVLIAARDAGVKRVVLASSAAVYGDSPILPKREDMKPEPVSPYAVSKHVNELYAKTFYNLYKFETVCLRYFNVYGPKQDPCSPYSGVISVFIDNVRTGKEPIIYGDGEQSRDFVYISDVVNANILASTAASAGKGEIINIATGKRITLNQLLKTLSALVNKRISPEYEPHRNGDIVHSQADISLANALLGYEAKVEFDEGLKKLFSTLLPKDKSERTYLP